MGFDVLIRLLVIFLAMVQPIVILLVCGEIISFSASWQTELQPLYIITNAATSYFLYSVTFITFNSVFSRFHTSIS
jgi:hypothetical protein